MNDGRRSQGGGPDVRAARPDESAAIADLYLRSRRAAVGVPPLVHDDDDVRSWIAETVLPAGGTWVTATDGRLAAMMVLDGVWVDQLYVTPEAQRRGHGSALLGLAQARRAELMLWTFEANRGARAFYERHGFVPYGPVDTTNEEGAPALRYRWRRADRPAGTAT